MAISRGESELKSWTIALGLGNLHGVGNVRSLRTPLLEHIFLCVCKLCRSVANSSATTCSSLRTSLPRYLPPSCPLARHRRARPCLPTTPPTSSPAPIRWVVTVVLASQRRRTAVAENHSSTNRVSPTFSEAMRDCIRGGTYLCQRERTVLFPAPQGTPPLPSHAPPSHSARAARPRGEQPAPSPRCRHPIARVPACAPDTVPREPTPLPGPP